MSPKRPFLESEETPEGARMLELGCGRADITACHVGVGMLGFGRFDQFLTGVGLPLCARAFAIFDPETGHRLMLVVAELCFVSQAVREAVIEKLASEHPELGLGSLELLITANHTHSGPGGFTHHLFYNINIPGFVEPVFRDIVEGITLAIVSAARARVPGRLRLARGSFEPDEPVAFNRSMRAFLRNPEAKGFGPGDSARVVDREMTLLRFETDSGRPIASLCWFGIHGTSIHGENRETHPDNKGMASLAMEAHAACAWGVEGFVAGFAQLPTGDVTPNFRYDRRRRALVGLVDDDREAARLHGEMQARLAIKLMEQASSTPELGTRLGAAIRFADQSDISVDPSFVGGREGLRSVPATVGLTMAAGTDEGPGAFHPLLPGIRALNAAEGLVQRLRHVLKFGPSPERDPRGPRFFILETGKGDRGRAFQLLRMGHPLLPRWTDPAIHFLRLVEDRGGMDPFPWTPTVLPVQILLIGPLAIAALPCEITTIAGRRLRAVIQAGLEELGVEHTLLTPYSNAYASYVTTPEEYPVQHYEAASTLYGRWTLPAWQTRFNELTRAMRAQSWIPHDGEGLSPPKASTAVLKAQAWAPQTTRPRAQLQGDQRRITG